ncbi:MAG: hypothetical protein RLZZ70_606 [Candidatus Parcubacteria bacterium]|jgi:hypothetical protein
MIGKATIHGRHYAIPLKWNAALDTYETVSFEQMLRCNKAGIRMWSQIGMELCRFARDEILYLLIPGVANLPHPPRRST